MQKCCLEVKLEWPLIFPTAVCASITILTTIYNILKYNEAFGWYEGELIMNLDELFP